MRTDIQLRAVDTDFDIRSDGSNGNTLVGHAAVFNSPTVVAGLFREQIAPRAFRKSIKESDVRALFNHNTDLVLGRNKSGTLRLKEDDVGLGYEIDLPDTQAARDLWTLVDRGDISGSSFAFETVKESRDNPESGSTDLPLITIREARLFDISPCTMPAYEDTDVSARVLMRCAALSGLSIDEVRAAYELGEFSRIWVKSAADYLNTSVRTPRVLEDRSCPAARDLPLADKGGGWDAAAARAHMQEAAGGEQWDPGKYGRGFLYVDSAAKDKLGSYKLPFADVRGSLKAIPEGIYAAAQRLDGTQISDADKASARGVLSSYYKKLGETAPWDRSADDARETREADEPAEPLGAPTPEPQDATVEPPTEALTSRHPALSRRDRALREVELLEIELL